MTPSDWNVYRPSGFAVVLLRKVKVGRSIKARYLSFIALLIVSGVVSGVVGAVWAHSGATGLVATRMDAMKDIGKQVKSLARMIRGQIDFDRQAARRAAAVAVHIRPVSALIDRAGDAVAGRSGS